jgi:hypothetical protein
LEIFAMTTLTLPRSAGAKPLRALVAFTTDFFAGIREGRAIRDRYDRLSRLSDRELARRGLDRRTLAQAAVRGFSA